MYLQTMYYSFYVTGHLGNVDNLFIKQNLTTLYFMTYET